MRAFGPADVLIPPGAGDSPCLEYSMWLFTMGAVTVDAMFAPTLNFIPWRGLKYSISLDNQKPEEIVLVPEDFNARNGNAEWEKTVSDNIRHSISKHFISSTGPHVLKIRMIDPGIVLQKIVVSTDEIKPSYLGPPESYRIIN